MRVREATLNHGQDYSYTYNTYNGNCTDINYYTSTTNSGITTSNSSSYMADVVTPNFQALVSRGVIINNPMEKSVIQFIDNACGVTSHRKSYVNGCTPVKKLARGNFYSGTHKSSYYINDSSFLTPAVPADLQLRIDQAVTKAWANVDVSKAQALVTLAEAKKTVSSLASILYRVYRIAKDLKSLRLKRLRNEISWKELQDRYMEIRYALRPLAYEASGIVDAINHDYGKRVDRLTFRSGETFEYSQEQQVNNHVGSISYQWTNYLKTFLAHYEIRTGVLVRIDSINKLNVWGLDAILSSAWELVPFSFILDWFFNVGKTIAAWSPKSGLTSLASWVTVKKTVTQSNTVNGCGQLNNYSSLLVNTLSLTDCFISRNELTTERTPDPNRVILPQFTLKLDSLKLLDLAIILKKFR